MVTQLYVPFRPGSVCLGSVCHPRLADMLNNQFQLLRYPREIVPKIFVQRNFSLQHREVLSKENPSGFDCSH